MTIELRGGLYIVSTPIGNLKDLSARAIEILENVFFIACEDTRVTGKLLFRYNIKTPMKAYHEHSTKRVKDKILSAISEDKAVAIVSDAGTPTISDPGYKLIKLCIKNNYYISAIPGASAAIAGLVLSGIPTNRFLFFGFLSSKREKKSNELAGLVNIPTTLIFYESPKRLVGTLQTMIKQLGNRPAAITRELTKRHEQVRRGQLNDLFLYYKSIPPPKGELVLIVGGMEEKIAAVDDNLDQIIITRLKSKSLRDTSIEVSDETGITKKLIYARALALSKPKN